VQQNPSLNLTRTSQPNEKKGKRKIDVVPQMGR
jgi:hypothetical protein